MLFTKKFDYLFLILLFLAWRVLLLVPLAIAPNYLPLQSTYLGGGMGNYSLNPNWWSWANFDGEHYLAIAQFGYRPLTYFFFPLYPLILQNIHSFFGDSSFSYLFAGLVISNVSFLIAIWGVFRLLSIDYNKKTVWLTIFFVMFFPTAYYFGSAYTESIFLALVVWAFYFSRKQKWLIACLLAALATSARVVGVVMLPALLMEYWIQSKNNRQRSIFPLILIFLVPLGIVIYMNFLQKTTGDPLAFFHSVEIFGEQRSSRLILLPQVFYRYIFKILPVINYSYFPLVFTTWMEMLTGIGFFLLSLVSFFKIRLSYAIFSLGAFIIPTLSGSFSSLPRYVLVLFPAFLVLAIISQKLPRLVVILLFLLSFIGLLYAESLFMRGYWVA